MCKKVEPIEMSFLGLTYVVHGTTVCLRWREGSRSDDSICRRCSLSSEFFDHLFTLLQQLSQQLLFTIDSIILQRYIPLGFQEFI